MKRFARSKVLLAIVALAVVAAMCTVSPAHAASSASAGRMSTAAPHGPAASDPPVVSGCGCWAGYVTHGSTYHAVGAVWQVPSIPASKAKQVVDFWVGLGGYQAPSGLEQIGIGDVTQDGKVYYIPWWEAIPWYDPLGLLNSTLPHNLPYSVKPGDVISASVSLTGSTYHMSMSDSRGINKTIWSVDKTVFGLGYSNDSAEVIIETGKSLPDFKQVFFDGAFVDNNPIGATNPTEIVWGTNDHRVDISPIGANGDNFVITTAAPQVPKITSVGTYTKGALVYFDIHYADPGNDAEGFGFVGVNGSGWAEENHPFSSPSYGIVGPHNIAYPFNEACGTAQQYGSYVKAWIYDTAGARSTPVVIHLVCTG